MIDGKDRHFTPRFPCFKASACLGLRAAFVDALPIQCASDVRNPFFIFSVFSENAAKPFLTSSLGPISAFHSSVKYVVMLVAGCAAFYFFRAAPPRPQAAPAVQGPSPAVAAAQVTPASWDYLKRSLDRTHEVTGQIRKQKAEESGF